MNRFNKEMAAQARSKLKINAKQSRRIYEILRLKNTDTTDAEQYQSYRLDVKNRLNAPFQVSLLIDRCINQKWCLNTFFCWQKKKNDMKKIQKVLKPEEYIAALSNLGIEETFQRLNSQYQALEACYKKVIDRLES